MSTTQQPGALRLADALERPGYGWHSTPAQCAAELRRLHAENTTLQQGYAAARLEIESLRARGGGVSAEHSREHLHAIMEAERNDSLSTAERIGVVKRFLLGNSSPARIYECGFTHGWDRAMRAAQPATADDRAAFKAYLEDCDECAIAPDIAGAFHAGWTSRVRAAQPAGARQPGAAYAEAPDLDAWKCERCHGKGWHWQSESVNHGRGIGVENVDLKTHCDVCDGSGWCGPDAAQAAPAAVAGPSEAVKFTDQSTADPVEKARRYLTAMGSNHLHSSYFFDDGYPKQESATDALATLAVLEQLAAAPTTQPAPQRGTQEPAKVIHDIDAGIEVMAWLRESRAPHSIYSKMSACLFGDSDKKAASQPSPASQGDGLDAVPTQAAPCDTPNYCRSVQRCTALDEARATKDRGQYD